MYEVPSSYATIMAFRAGFFGVSALEQLTIYNEFLQSFVTFGNTIHLSVLFMPPDIYQQTPKT